MTKQQIKEIVERIEDGNIRDFVLYELGDHILIKITKSMGDKSVTEEESLPINRLGEEKNFEEIWELDSVVGVGDEKKHDTEGESN